VSLVKSKQRVADHGEVFTPPEIVEAMIELVADEANRIDSRFLEPACGSGNFLVPVLQRKLKAVDARYGKSDFERRNQALLALMSIYGVEILPDNVVECRNNLLTVFVDHLDLDEDDDLTSAARAVLYRNIVHGDALTMQTQTSTPMPITFAEWAYLGRGRFQRRDFEFAALTTAGDFTAKDSAQRTRDAVQDSLFADLGKHELFTPAKDHGCLTVAEIGGVAK